MKGAKAKAVKVKAVEKTLKILEILAKHDAPLPLTQVGQMAQMSLSTVHRLLNTLCSSGFVERVPVTGHYRLGLKAFLIGNAALQNVSLRPAALEVMQELSEQVNESIYLAVLSHQNVVYSDAVRTAGPIQIGIQTGTPFPAYQTGSGRLLLAYLSLPEQERLIHEYLLQSNALESKRLLKELAVIRKNGFTSGNIGMGSNIREFAAPIFNHQNACLGAISIFRPLSDEGLAISDVIIMDELRLTAGKISHKLGFTGEAI